VFAGLRFSKYLRVAGATQRPPMKFLKVGTGFSKKTQE
jgi:hypothetical protein